jgi:hypothetical protein
MVESGLLELAEPVAGTGHRRQFAPTRSNARG